MVAMTTADFPQLLTTTGRLSLTLLVGVEAAEEDWPRVAEALKPTLQAAINDSDTSAATGARCTGVLYELPPTGKGYTLSLLVTCVVDLEAWNKALGPGETGEVVSGHLGGLLASAADGVDGAEIGEVTVRLAIL